MKAQKIQASKEKTVIQIIFEKMINPQKEIPGWSVFLSHSDLSPGREFCPHLAGSVGLLPTARGSLLSALAFPLTLIELHFVVSEKTTVAFFLF